MKRRLSCRMMWRSTGLLAYIVAGTWWSGRRAHPHHVLLVVEHISAVMNINHFNSAFTSFKTRLIICLIIPFINPFRWTCCMWLYYRHPGIGERRIKNCGAACVVCSVNFRPVWAAKHNSDSNKNQLIRQNETKRNSKQQNKNSIIPFINSSWFFFYSESLLSFLNSTWIAILMGKQIIFWVNRNTAAWHRSHLAYENSCLFLTTVFNKVCLAQYSNILKVLIYKAHTDM